MADITLTDFKGITSNVDPKDLSGVNFSDGSNFYINNGSIYKRNGCIKKHSAVMNGAVSGIYIINNPSKPARTNAAIPVSGELILSAGGYIYTGKW